MSMIIKAQTFALIAHAGQKYGNKPFIEHPRDVARLVKEYNFNKYVIAAAWLHDTIEDSPHVTFETIEKGFGSIVAYLVQSVTDEPGKNRKERAKKTLPKIRSAGPTSVGLKLCDRISNVEAAIRDKDSLINMYKKEYSKFKEVLYKKGELEELWERLDKHLKK